MLLEFTENFKNVMRGKYDVIYLYIYLFIYLFIYIFIYLFSHPEVSMIKKIQMNLQVGLRLKECSMNSM
jgi:hypothetical protein